MYTTDGGLRVMVEVFTIVEGESWTIAVVFYLVSPRCKEYNFL